MRINVHTHIFNLRAILTRGTVDIISNRLVKDPKLLFLRDAVSDFLHDRLLNPGLLDEAQITRLLVAKVTARPEFRAQVDALGGAAALDVRNAMQDGVEHLTEAGLEALTHKLTGVLRASEDHGGTDFFDILAMLLVAGKHEIRDVAATILAPLDAEDAIVPLMLDICRAGDPNQDREAFHYQLRATSEAALVYPGRVVPFVNVSPFRADFLAMVQSAIGSMGFAGVKLYPSLGYSVDLASLEPLYDYCVANDVPLLMHCNQGGFFATAQDPARCEPRIWEPTLKKYPGLRICFAHCGGDDFVASSGFGAADSWANQILGLMDRFEHVYADIAFHTAPMEGGEAERVYFENLLAILSDANRGSRILFGSDAWLVRQRISEENYWEFFRRRFDDASFAKLTDANPRRFLGLPGSDRVDPAPNIARYLDFLGAHRNTVWTQPAPWVSAALEKRTGAPVAFRAGGAPAWSQNNRAHVRTFVYLRDNHFTGAQSGVKFANAAGVELFRLGYWTRQRESDDVVRRRCEIMARSLVREFELSGATFEPSMDRNVALNRIAGELFEGTESIATLATHMDEFMRFEGEP